MPDPVRVPAEGETPVNPYSLLEAVNSSSETANTAWLIFLALVAYLTITVAGVTHKDLLLETPVPLPVLQVSIQQAQFFRFAPIILVLFHLGVVSQLVLLARKTLEFDFAVRQLETSYRRTHPLRLELHNFFFVQAVAGPQRSFIMSAFLHGMSWLTLVILPVVLLLYIQLTYLPFHDIETTWVHRICLAFDIAVLVLIGVFLMRAETSFFVAFLRTTLHHPLSFFFTLAVLGIVALFSFFVATVPGEGLDAVTRRIAVLDSSQQAAATEPRPGLGITLPFLRARADGSLWGLFHRNLVVTDYDFVPEKAFAPDEMSLNLRGRDLRFAKLDRSDLHRADMTGANLEGASLVGADLRGTRLNCADMAELILSDDRARAKCADASAANFARAQLGGARLQGLDLRDAKLDEANLESADLAYSLLQGANLPNAQLQMANLTGAQAQGANFLVATLQGADLTGAQLQAADLSNASMQGVILSHAALEAATLRDVDLEGADLQQTKLYGSNMSGAKVRAADLRGAAVWATNPPAPESLALADMGEIILKPVEQADLDALRSMLERLQNPRVRAEVSDALEPIMDPESSGKWAASSEQQTWQSYIAIARAGVGEGYGAQLTDHLAGLMCKARWSNASVATGIAKRAQGEQFRGNMATVYDRLRARDCPASETISKRLMQTFAAQVDATRGN